MILCTYDFMYLALVLYADDLYTQIIMFMWTLYVATL